MSQKSAFERISTSMEERIFPTDGLTDGVDPCEAACFVSKELNKALPEDFHFAPSECLLVWELSKR